MLPPLETLYEREGGIELPLTPALKQIYGALKFPDHSGRPYVISNFVTTLDGVTTLGIPGHETGKEISGANPHDRMMMGLLRAVADAVVIGTGSLSVVPHALWTAEYIDHAFADEYRALRKALRKSETPLNVIVTGSGDIDTNLPVFQSGHVQTLIVTTADGADKLSHHSLPSSTRVVQATNHPHLDASEILNAVVNACGAKDGVVLVEGGPTLMGDWFAARLLDEQFLTLAPQIAGRDDKTRRPGFVDGKSFAPDSPVWGKLVGIKRAGEMLFLRYAFETKGRL